MHLIGAVVQGQSQGAGNSIKKTSYKQDIHVLHDTENRVEPCERKHGGHRNDQEQLFRLGPVTMRSERGATA